MNTDIKAITEAVQKESAFIEPFFVETAKVIVGQKPMLERLLIGLLCTASRILGSVTLTGMRRPVLEMMSPSFIGYSSG